MRTLLIALRVLLIALRALRVTLRILRISLRITLGIWVIPLRVLRITLLGIRGMRGDSLQIARRLKIGLLVPRISRYGIGVGIEILLNIDGLR